MDHMPISGTEPSFILVQDSLPNPTFYISGLFVTPQTADIKSGIRSENLGLNRTYPDSKTMLGQRWHRVVRLAYGWSWKYNVGPTLPLR